MQMQFLNPVGLCPTFGWTHVVTATGGKTVYVSGQVSVNERGEVVGKGDLRAQTEQTFQNLKHALAAVGAGARYVNAEHPPASTLVGVSALVGADWLIEVEVVAALPE